MRDDRELKQIKNRVEINSESLRLIVDSIVSRFSSEMTTEVNKVKALLDRREELTDDEVEKLVMRMPVYMYYAASGLESMGVELDMASAIKAEAYNLVFGKEAGTLKDRDAIAKAQSFNEQLIEISYQRAYKKLKLQLEMAEAVYSGAKKVLSKRMIELEMSRKNT